MILPPIDGVPDSRKPFMPDDPNSENTGISNEKVRQSQDISGRSEVRQAHDHINAKRMKDLFKKYNIPALDSSDDSEGE